MIRLLMGAHSKCSRAAPNQQSFSKDALLRAPAAFLSLRLVPLERKRRQQAQTFHTLHHWHFQRVSISGLMSACCIARSAFVKSRHRPKCAPVLCCLRPEMAPFPSVSYKRALAHKSYCVLSPLRHHVIRAQFMRRPRASCNRVSIIST